MKRLNKSVQITPTFTRSDWQLFEMDDADWVVFELNKALALLVNSGASRSQVQFEMLKLMSAHSRFGASDSEPRRFLSYVLEEVFGNRE